MKTGLSSDQALGTASLIAGEATRPRRARGHAQPDGLHANAVFAAAKPILSVLTPTFHHDPRRLLAALETQAQRGGMAIEVIVLDDGSDDDALTATITEAVDAMVTPAAYVRLDENVGRAEARNQLARHARGQHMLYLDADTLPDSDDFLSIYMAQIEQGDPALVVGGYSLVQTSQAPEFALHRAIASRLDCLPAAVRQTEPWRYTFGSNVLVRGDIMRVTPFSAHYRGWGWEDQEWAVRVSQNWQVRHVDNTVSHLGMDTVESLLTKYASSAENFRYLIADHPQLAKGSMAFRAASLLQHVPFKKTVRAIAAIAARASWLPMSARVFALRLFRVMSYVASQHDDLHQR